MSKELLENRDYTLIVAKNASADANKIFKLEDAWTVAQKAIQAIAKTCESFNSAGISVYLATQPFQHYRHISSTDLAELLPQALEQPMPQLSETLGVAIDDYFARKAAGKTLENGEVILVMLDQEPSDRMTLVKLIKNAAQRMDHNDELGISFIQIGDNLITRGFLNSLDQDLQGMGAAFDMVDTKPLEHVQDGSLAQVLVDAFRD